MREGADDTRRCQCRHLETDGGYSRMKGLAWPPTREGEREVQLVASLGLRDEEHEDAVP